MSQLSSDGHCLHTISGGCWMIRSASHCPQAGATPGRGHMQPHCEKVSTSVVCPCVYFHMELKGWQVGLTVKFMASEDTEEHGERHAGFTSVATEETDLQHSAQIGSTVGDWQAAFPADGENREHRLYHMNTD